MNHNILIIALDINPSMGSEAGKAYKWLKIISHYYNAEVITQIKHKKDITENMLQNVNYSFIKICNPILYNFLTNLKMYNILYKLYIKKARVIINEKIKTVNYSLIHCLTPSGMHSYNKLYKLNIPVLIGPVGGAIEYPKCFKQYMTFSYIMRNFFYSMIKRSKAWINYYQNSRHIIIGTEYIKKHLPKECLVKTTIIFDTTVDTDIFTPKKRENEDIVKIIFCGRLELLKGCMIILYALNNLIKKGYKNIQLSIIGNGSRYREMEKYINKNNLQKYVSMIGNISHKEVIQYLQDSDIFCLPTLRENGGGAILEAMACGLPIVTTNYGGPKYSVTSECGIKIEPAEINAFTNELTIALERLINNPDERIQLGKNARDRAVNNFSIQAIEKKILKIYADIINNL